MSRKEVGLENQLELVISAYDKQLALQIQIIAKREDVANYQLFLSSDKLSKPQKVSILNELKNSMATLKIFEKNNDLGLNFTNQFTLLLDALNKSPHQDYEKSKNLMLDLLDQFEQKFSAHQMKINELSKSGSYELYKQHDLNFQTLVQVLSDLDNKMSKDLTVHIDKFQKLLKSPDLNYSACVSAISEINELLDRFKNKEDLPLDMKNLLVLLDKQYEAFYYRGLAESYPELNQACADVAGPLVTVVDRLFAKPPQKISEFLDRYQQAVQVLGDQYLQHVVLNQEDFDGPINYIKQALKANDLSHEELDTAAEYAVELKKHVDNMIEEASEQVNNLPPALRDMVNQRTENLRAEVIQLQGQFPKPVSPELEARVVASLDTLKQFEAVLDSLTQLATLTDDQKRLIKDTQKNAQKVSTDLSDVTNSNQPLHLEVSEQVNIIQAKANVLSDALSSNPQDLSQALPALQAALTKLVQEDRTNQMAQKNAESSVSKTLHELKKAMTQFFKNTIPSLIHSIQQSKVLSQSSRKSVSHETGKAWVAVARSKVQDTNSVIPAGDPGETFAKKKQ